jgi:hypothetical protein
LAKYGNFTQNGAYNAGDYRFSEAGPYARDTAGKITPGVLYTSATDGRIRVSGTSLNIVVDPFTAVVPDAGRGAYVGGVDVATTFGPFQPEASNNRIDLVCWRPLEGEAVDSWGVTTMANITLAGSTTPISKQVVPSEVYFVKGSPSSSSSPPVPITPVGSVRLGQVYVPGGAASITTANIDNSTRQWTSVIGGVITVPGAANGQASTYPTGTQVLNPTTGVNYVVSGGFLTPLLTEGRWTQFTPSFLTAAGTPTVGNGVLVGRYLKTGKEIHVRIHMVSGTTTNWGIGQIRFGNLPEPHVGSGTQAIGTAVTYSDGADWQGFARMASGGTTIDPHFPFSDVSNKMYPFQNSDGSGSGGTGVPRKAGAYTLGPYHTVSVDITYEIA